MTKRKTVDIKLRGYSKMEPTISVLNFSTISNFYTQREYTKRFIYKLNKDLIKSIGEANTKEIFKLLSDSKIKIVNQSTFFTFDVQSNYDIGFLAFKNSPKDVDLFMAEVTREISKGIEKGKTSMDLSSIFLLLAQFRQDIKETDEYYRSKMKSIAMTLAGQTVTSVENNPFFIEVIPPSMTKDILEEYKLNTFAGYLETMNFYLEALYTLYENHKKQLHVPEIRLVLPIYENVRFNQIELLRRIYRLTMKEIKTLTGHIEDLGEDSEELTDALNEMNVYSKRTETPIEGVKARLKQIKKEYPLFTHSNSDDSELRNVIRGDHYLEGKYLKTLKFKRFYVDRDSFIQTCYRQFLEMKINCFSVKSFEELEPLIDACAQILLTGLRDRTKKASLIALSTDIFLKIILCDVGILSVEFLNQLKEKEKQLLSLHNKRFKITLNYEKKTATSICGMPIPTYVRIISDIHADINEPNHYVFDFGTDFVINCGDTSGDYFTTRGWIKTYMTEGVSVTGNHLGYTNLGERAKMQTADGVPFNGQPKNGQQKLLQDYFHLTRTPVLSNDMYEYNEMIFLGNTLYTDFNLFGESNKIACMAEANAKINDFRYCTFFKIDRTKKKGEKKEGEEVPFTPSIQARLFEICSTWIEGRLKNLRKEGNTKPIIIVTHHIPTPYGVEAKYKHDPLSAAFASDLRSLVHDYPEIRLWAYGHTHHPHQYIIGNCRFVCHPFGYYNENNFDVNNYGLRIPIIDIKSKKSWTELLKKEIEEGTIKVYKK